MSLFAEAFSSWADGDEERAGQFSYLAEREIPAAPERPTELTSGIVIDYYGPADCNKMLRQWIRGRDKLRTRTALDLIEALHGLEMERAARPVQVTLSVPVTPAAAAPDKTMLETTPQLRERMRFLK